jgi:hypothetical protein
MEAQAWKTKPWASSEARRWEYPGTPLLGYVNFVPYYVSRDCIAPWLCHGDKDKRCP